MTKISDCCGAAPITIEEMRGDRIRQSNSEDNGICPECMEDCEYIEDDDDPVCETCDGEGQVWDGPSMDPDSSMVDCPDCSWQPDPDEKFERQREMRL
jgi:predicted amidophosphoribosyltransferase